uniref:PDZ domain-containing protein n=1 Tax=Panagrolaimus sp. JU765 TaxID=591449 RepID=A0AC34RLU1_9BILA
MTSPSQKPDQSEQLNSDPTKRIVEVELEKNESGFGFNITGGTDEPYIPGHNGIFIARIRPDGVAARDGRLREGDRIISVNDHVLSGKTHNEAVEIFKQATGKVRLLIEQDAETIVLSKSLVHPN